MASGKSVPAGSGPPNLWEEFSRFHGACAAVLGRAERCLDQGEALSESEKSELRTMALNLGALGRLLHGKRGRDMRLLAERLDQVLKRCGPEAAARDLDGEEPERDPATMAN